MSPTRWSRVSELFARALELDPREREHFLARFLEEAGFVPSAPGFQMRRQEPVPHA